MVDRHLAERFCIRQDDMPIEMRLLLRDCPRDSWPAHPGLKQATRNWLGAHQMFRRLGAVMRTRTAAFLDKANAAELGYDGQIMVSNLRGHHHFEDHTYFPDLKPDPDDIAIIKTTDSALTGTNLRLMLRNMEIKDVLVVGIFTDQCVSSTVRSLADESFGMVVEDCCAAATMELHEAELRIINMIYCHVASKDETMGFFL